ncbi:MAG: hypothetical protein ABFR97_10770 [Thermodesulfobacteriota bacterium]
MFGKVNKEGYQAVIFTQQFRIAGTVHLLAEERVSDYLDDQDNLFIPVTGATVSNHQDGQVTKAPFLCLNKKDVTMLIPDLPPPMDDDLTPPAEMAAEGKI